MVLDILKEHADDAFFTEEHIIFLASKFRVFLLERKYKNSRNQTYQNMSDENLQEICLDLEPTDVLPYGCSGMWLKSTQKIPNMVGSYEPKLFVPSDMVHSMVTMIPPERMPYVGYNKWLKNIIYAAKSSDGYLYLKGNNPQFLYLEKARLQGIFSNPEEAAKLSCDGDGNGNGCDILSMDFPLEEALIPSCIELIVQELIGSRYAPEDKSNDAKDNLGDAAVTNSKPARPAERMAAPRPKEEEAE